MTLSESTTSEALVSKARRGDPEAFAELYALYAERTFRAAIRSCRSETEAEEIRQEIWLRVNSNLGHLRDDAAFPSWLYQLTARICVDASRRRRQWLPIDQARE